MQLIGLNDRTSVLLIMGIGLAEMFGRDRLFPNWVQSTGHRDDDHVRGEPCRGSVITLPRSYPEIRNYHYLHHR